MSTKLTQVLVKILLLGETEQARSTAMAGFPMALPASRYVLKESRTTNENPHITIH